jgi:hypothetical protein
MTDTDPVKQALAELQDLVRCRCHEAYKGRGLHDPDCDCDSADAVKAVADRIEALVAKLATCEKYRNAYSECDRIGAQAVRDLEAKLAKAVEALDGCMIGGNHLVTWLPENHLPVDTNPLAALVRHGAGVSHDIWCCWRSIMQARTTLAELKGDKT